MFNFSTKAMFIQINIFHLLIQAQTCIQRIIIGI